ncbi:glycoprotein-N-acetylgalactosamine 3-beta-galactosyltransferase 1 isoform X2 [Eurytemora carolleeae]|nr:glycoprotein-N-acetylgalactosamine 3-beta-galactosyltransferase 1 isoform X2 [Eurytemora carolleeae]|eukprot:XP_023346975.1 glycoprotein-N-acetylgalactosamine 3-beta-galactosyltransferase 1-like isoform X2 [Eurytemora affinis]
MPNDFGTKILFNYQSGGLLHWKKTENVTQTMKTLFQNSTMDLEDENVGEEMNQTSYKYHLSNEFKQFKPNRSPIRLLCLILTRPATLSTKAQAVYDTWGSRCTFLYFLSTKSDLGDFGLPVLHNPAKETYANLWSKTKFGFKFAYKHHIDQIDWILKADDDTYVIMENLHAMLALYDPDIPTLFGAHYNKIVPGGTVSGGAGYLLSR